MRIRTIWRWTIAGLACYGAAHLVNLTVRGARAWPSAPLRPLANATLLSTEQQPLVSALCRMLTEDGVPLAERWACAIVRAAPTTDLGYLALVTAQIRRESRFLAPDLEWLYQSVVPELVHDLGVADPIHTLGPMQVQRWRLQDYFEQATGRHLDAGDVRDLALDIETGVAACLAVLDPIVREYLPDRRVRGWVNQIGPAGLLGEVDVLASEHFGGHAERRTEALRQKLLSDLTGAPLALDGVRGAATEDLLRAHPDLAALGTLHERWRARFGVPAPEAIAPRIAHEPRLAFVLADFHSGTGASRTAALQALLDDLFSAGIACDGKWGPLTRAAVPELLEDAEPDPARRAEFAAMVAAGRHPQWLRGQLLAMARRLHRERTGRDGPDALVPDLWFDGMAQEVKGLGRMSVAGYVAGSVAFFEDYLARLVAYTGGASTVVPGGG